MYVHMIEQRLELIRLLLPLQQFDSFEGRTPELLDQHVQQHQQPRFATRLAMRIALVETTMQQTGQCLMRVPGLPGTGPQDARTTFNLAVKGNQKDVIRRRPAGCEHALRKK